MLTLLYAFIMIKRIYKAPTNLYSLFFTIIIWSAHRDGEDLFIDRMSADKEVVASIWGFLMNGGQKDAAKALLKEFNMTQKACKELKVENIDKVYSSYKRGAEAAEDAPPAKKAKTRSSTP